MKIPSFNTIFQTNREKHGDFTVPSLLRVFADNCNNQGVFQNLLLEILGAKLPASKGDEVPESAPKNQLQAVGPYNSPL